MLPVGSADQVAAAWQNHLRLVRRSLERGYYQGWDLHPAQLPTRFAATFAFYRDGFPAAAARLRRYVGRQDSAILDEPATVRALADFVVRALDCGATDDAEVQDLTRLDRPTLDRLARRAVVIADPRRGRLGPAVFWVGARALGFDRNTVSDGMTSLRRGYTAEELGGLLARAGVRATVERRPGYRLVATWRPG